MILKYSVLVLNRNLNPVYFCLMEHLELNLIESSKFIVSNIYSVWFKDIALLRVHSPSAI